MTDDINQIDTQAMEERYKASGSKMAYEEWLAVQLVDHAGGNKDAIVFKQIGDTRKLKDFGVIIDEAGEVPEEAWGKQKKRDSKLKETVLKATKAKKKTRKTQKKAKNTDNTDSVKKKTVSKKSVSKKAEKKSASKNTRAKEKPKNKAQDSGGDSPNAEENPKAATTNADSKLPPEEQSEYDASVSDLGKSYMSNPDGIKHSEKLLEQERQHDALDFDSIDHTTFNITAKQYQFCMEYIKDLNGTRAYKDAYGVTNARTAASNSHKLLINADIKHCIEVLFRIRRDKLRRLPSAHELATDAQAVLNRVAELAAVDLSAFIRIGEDGYPRYDFSGATPEQLRGITGMKIKQGKIIEYEDGEPVDIPVYEFDMKMDPLKANTLLMKHHGLLVEKVEIDDKRDIDPKELARRLAFALKRGEQSKPKEKK